MPDLVTPTLEAGSLDRSDGAWAPDPPLQGALPMTMQQRLSHAIAALAAACALGTPRSLVDIDKDGRLERRFLKSLDGFRNEASNHDILRRKRPVIRRR